MRAANSVSGFCLLQFFLLCQSKANAYNGCMQIAKQAVVMMISVSDAFAILFSSIMSK